MKPDLVLVDTSEEYAVEPGRKIRQQPGEYNLDYLLRIDDSKDKARKYVLWLESKVKAEEQAVADLLTLRNALEFYASRKAYSGEDPAIEADNGERARTALQAIRNQQKEPRA